MANRVPTDKVTKNDVQKLINILTRVAWKWYELGLQLGIQDWLLRIIRKKHSNDCEAQLREMLMERLNQGEPLTWGALVEALESESVREHEVAERIRSQFSIPRPPVSIAQADIEIGPSSLSISSASPQPSANRTLQSPESISAISVPPETSTPAQLETTATAGPVSATPAPAIPLTAHDNSSPSFLVTASFKQRVESATTEIEHLQEEFSNIKSETRRSLSERENRDQSFVGTFRDHLLDLPCTKKQVHLKFFVRNEKEILESDTIQKLFIILGRHCNYTNYEIILHIVKRFCKDLTQRMLSYRDSLIVFEKATTVDVYLCAILAPPGGRVSAGFMRMTVKINKPASECTLHEIRQLKESIEEEAVLESYAMYIETPEPGSVCVRLCITEEVGWMVGVVLTPDFRQNCLLSEVTVKRYLMIEEMSLTEYLVRNDSYNTLLLFHTQNGLDCFSIKCYILRKVPTSTSHLE